MSYKTRQLLGFGSLFAIMLLILAVSASFLYSIDRSVNITIAERYDKLKAGSDLRSAFYALDSELGRLSDEDDPGEIQQRLDKIAEYRQLSLERLLIVERFDVSEKGIVRLAAIRTAYDGYLDAAEQMTAEILEGAPEGSLVEPGSKTEEFRAQLVENLDAFQAAQQNALSEARADSGNAARNMLWSMAISAPLLLAAAAVLSLWTIRSTARRLQNVSNVMRSADFKENASLPRLDARVQDEIGDIEASFNAMAASLEHHNRQEREMTANLEEHTWIQTTLAESFVLYQNINSVEQLASTFLQKTVPLSGAAYGVFYLRVGEQDLVRIASFSDYSAEASIAAFKMGEGLVGRAAISGEFLLIEDLPEHYLRVASGLGEMPPRSLLVAPVHFERRVEAVVELASLHVFTSAQRRLVEQLVGTLGIAISGVSDRMEVDRLLRQTQQSEEELQSQTEELQVQSEELRTQQETLRNVNDGLERTNLQVEEKNRLLEIAQRDLLLSAEFQSEFLANMSHELRTPLNSILILSQLLSEKEDGILTDQEREYATTIYSSGHDLLGLIDDILDLAKAESGKMEVTIEAYNLTELPQAMQGLFNEVAKKKDLAFEIATEPGLPKLIWTDGRRLQQIVQNLLSNAIKFTSEGQVALRIASTTLPSPEGCRSGIRIEVTDTGIGIEPEKQELIFEAFRQADGSTERRFGGTGLGLSICREFSRLLGGTILLNSTPGQGSTFTVLLPTDLRNADQSAAESIEVSAGPVSSSPAEDESDSESLEEMPAIQLPREQDGDHKIFKGRRLLIVDDDARNIYAISVALESRGAEIGIAENGREALEILAHDPAYDLVLMDIMMPVMDGYEAMRSLRSQPMFAELPIIVFTAKAMKDERELCLEAGASDYISKPLDVEKLFSLLRVWLSR
ncbi:ATP-binding protein [Saccharibacillus endophyticus]|uniref:histidine kinase n=1 Tax=Saccharibacillus endophyticus TaxID=2060666 RepID=A0ABQ1ZYM9_9BACL|nr:ATP-binding protein [Saccharibacillus endophyticus]GGH82663.1 histidine kinase [Saccharibacillus endophyticus]